MSCRRIDAEEEMPSHHQMHNARGHPLGALSLLRALGMSGERAGRGDGRGSVGVHDSHRRGRVFQGVELGLTSRALMIYGFAPGVQCARLATMCCYTVVLFLSKSGCALYS